MYWIEFKKEKVKVFGKKSKIPFKTGLQDEHIVFLDSILTNDIKKLEQNKFYYALKLNKNGYAEKDFFVFKEEDFFIIDTDLSADILIEEFQKLKLSLKVYFEKLQGYRHFYLFGEDAEEFIKNRFDITLNNFEFKKLEDIYIAKNPVRLNQIGFDIFTKNEDFINLLKDFKEISEKDFEDLRIKNCVPKIGKELKEGIIPLETNIVDYAFSFNKGCYVGQEVIARVYFRGKSPRTLSKFEILNNLKEEEKIIEEKPIGFISSINSENNYALGFILRAKAEEGKIYKTENNGEIKLLKIC
ncbi:hypothetical protein JCM14244_14120 [Venenivibrio stagnispumantis]|uniref:GCVT N-terminal domain-containing protein n=1 Tax=Venenivibrio stagnispumantis TaxID=407998 RepID=A0AA46ADZ8_9AQUI|nr:folate-binding protein [Venenivibrio stagnispumantis]MCW4573853.1 folate-binding protein [Venenivibrio stagnispumantis]SMP10026.1 hypothetical protein SAMN06264868_10761 [Venenivibrio stagnispumantis]